MSRIQEQLEPFISGQASADSLDEAERAYVQQMSAIRGRTRAAFGGVHAPADLADRIRTAARQAADGSTEAAGSRRWIRLWPAIAAAAALLIGVPLVFQFSGQGPAYAAPKQLAEIHMRNMNPHPQHADMFTGESPDEMAAWFKERTGFAPVVLTPCEHLKLKACCVETMGDRQVATYVVRLIDEGQPMGELSVIVITETPEQLGLSEQRLVEQTTVYFGRWESLRIAATRLDGRTYVAVGSADLGDDWMVAPLIRVRRCADGSYVPRRPAPEPLGAACMIR